jgi:hypothetical protein
MKKGRSMFGVLVVLALALSAVAAQGASAAENTAYTCAPGGTQFSNATCTTAGTGFGHVVVPVNTSTAITGTGGLTKLATTISGVAVQLQATSVDVTGTMENHVVGTEMVASGEGTITYTGVTVTAPAGKGCKVFEKKEGETLINEGMVSTNVLKASTAGLTHNLNFSPASGSTFASFQVSGCSIAALNGLYEVTGSVQSTSIVGTATKFTHANTTAQGTLKVRGQVAGIEGELNLFGANGNPLALTP